MQISETTIPLRPSRRVCMHSGKACGRDLTRPGSRWGKRRVGWKMAGFRPAVEGKAAMSGALAGRFTARREAAGAVRRPSSPARQPRRSFEPAQRGVSARGRPSSKGVQGYPPQTADFRSTRPFRKSRRRRRRPRNRPRRGARASTHATGSEKTVSEMKPLPLSTWILRISAASRAAS